MFNQPIRPSHDARPASRTNVATAAVLAEQINRTSGNDYDFATRVISEALTSLESALNAWVPARRTTTVSIGVRNEFPYSGVSAGGVGRWRTCGFLRSG